ncbi:MAG: 30S ribosomal protein S1 [Candidatus Microthrix parvicella]|nr:30S ribosomal protein S1 [Candidatus Microthrix parvicella]
MPAPASRGGAPSGPDVHVGRIVTAVVDEVGDREIILKMVDGRPGVVMRKDVTDVDGDVPQVGATIEVALLAREDPQGRMATSRGWAAKQQSWERIDAALASGELLKVKALKQVKGGLLVDLGQRAFLPASQAFEGSGGDLAELVGVEVEVRVTEADRQRDRVVVSRRDAPRKRRRAEERSVFQRLEVGATVTGRVVAMVEFGALVDLAGARGLLHRTEMSWGRVDRLEDFAVPGQELELVVIEVNRSKRRIGLSLRRLSDDPLAKVEEGSIEDATVTRVVDYGVFAELASGAEGLVHLSEMAEGRGYRPEELVAPGEAVRVKVMRVDPKRRRVELSMVQAALASP